MRGNIAVASKGCSGSDDAAGLSDREDLIPFLDRRESERGRNGDNRSLSEDLERSPRSLSRQGRSSIRHPMTKRHSQLGGSGGFSHGIITPQNQVRLSFNDDSTTREEHDTRSIQFETPNSGSPAAPAHHATGWRTWSRVAFERIRRQTLTFSPVSSFAHAVTLDLRISRSQHPALGSKLPSDSQGEMTTISRARRRAFTVFGRGNEYILAGLIGACTAASAAWTELVLEHFSDLRFGYCRGMFWLPRNLCCGSSSAVDFLGNRCIPPESPPANTIVFLLAMPGLPPEGDLVEPDPFSGAVVQRSIDFQDWVSWHKSLSVWIPPYLHGHWIDVIAYISVGVTLAVLACILCKRIAPAAAGSGIPEIKVILGGFSLPQVLSPWTLVTKLVGLAMAVASGLGLGKEGPMVHIGSSWADLCTRLVYMDPVKKNALVSAGCAAGVSTAFGAPVGGVLFALEEVSTYFPPSTLYRTLLCSVVASLVLKKLSPKSSGNGTNFQLDAIALQGRWEIMELIPFTIVATLGGIVGAIFIRLNVKLQKFKIATRPDNSHRQQRSIGHLITKTAAWCIQDPTREILVVAVVFLAASYSLPLLRFSPNLLMKHMFTRCARDGIGSHDIFGLCVEVDLDGTTAYRHNISLGMLQRLSVALLIYFLNCLISSGLFLPSGLFVPSLTIGSLLGRIAGVLTVIVDQRFTLLACRDCIHPGVYSILGAIAVLAGVTRMTVSLVVIAFEMTGGLGYIVPFMLVTLVARWTAEFFVEPSIFDVHIQLKRLPFLHLSPQSSEHAVAYGYSAKDLMDRDLVCIDGSQSWTLSMAWTFATEFNYSTYPVISDAKTKYVLGCINRRRLLHKLNAAVVNKATGRIPINFSNATPSTFEDGNDGRVLDFSDIVERVPLQINPQVSLMEVHYLFLQLGLCFLLFTEKGRLKGILTKKSFLARLERLRGDI